MKNKGIGITLIILLLAIVCCLIIFLVNYLKGGIKFKNGIINVTTKSSNVILDRKFEIEDIKKHKFYLMNKYPLLQYKV